MKLNPLDIRRQQFARKTFGGVDADEVDGFLKQLADQWEDLLDELHQAHARTQEAESKLKHYERVELALQEALETTRDTGRRAEAMAEQKARLVIDDAELRARQIVQDAERERYGMRQDLAKLSSRQNEIGARLRGFLLSELEILAQFQGDDPVGFIKLQPANPPPEDARAIAPSPERLAAPDAPRPEAEAPAADPPAADPPPADPPPADASPAFQPTDAPPADAPAAPAPEAPRPAAEAPPADPSTPTDPPAPGEAAAPSEVPASTWTDEPSAPPSWDLRSLVTGSDANVAGSEAERERIRRILDDLD